MKTIRIRPGKKITGKHSLRTWYKIVLGFTPYGYKYNPWCIVNKRNLPYVFKALKEEWYKKFY